MHKHLLKDKNSVKIDKDEAKEALKDKLSKQDIEQGLKDLADLGAISEQTDPKTKQSDIKLNDDFEVIVARAAPAPPPPFSQIGPTVRQGQSFTLKCKNAEKYKEISEMTLLPMGKFFSEDWHGGAGKVTLALEKIDEGSYKAQVPYTAATGVVFVKLDGDTVGKMVVVFNPYQKGSLVYLKDKKERQEYVLNTKGRL